MRNLSKVFATKLPSTPQLLHFTKGNQLSNNPIKKISKNHFVTFHKKPLSRSLFSVADRLKTNAIAFPTAKRKKGNTKSVGVQPCHGACSKGGYIYFQDPGLLTKIIKATVAPRKTSSE
jgi:hypothetical protein